MFQTGGVVHWQFCGLKIMRSTVRTFSWTTLFLVKLFGSCRLSRTRLAGKLLMFVEVPPGFSTAETTKPCLIKNTSLWCAFYSFNGIIHQITSDIFFERAFVSKSCSKNISDWKNSKSTVSVRSFYMLHRMVDFYVDA